MIGQENMNEIEQYVIDFIRSMRLNQKLSQRDLGNIIGVSQEFIRDVESKKRPAKYNLRHINALADYFNMSPKDFLPEKAFADNPKEKTKPVKKTSSIVKKAVVQSKATKSKKK